MRIAIIGSGISGLTAAYLLAPHADVTLIEKDSRLGGHANTIDVRFGEKSFPVDTGFMVFNPIHYPYFVALQKELGISSVDTIMSFSVSIPGEVEYSSNLSGLFGDVRQLMKPAYWRLLVNILRFNAAGKRYLASTTPDSLTIGQFIEKEGLSRELKEWYRFPMMGSIWSAASEDLSEYPARETFRFLNNHMLLNIFDKPIWQTVKDGSRAYVRALETRLSEEGVTIRKHTDTAGIVRDADGVTIALADGSSERFEKVILATHPDTALSLLTDPSDDEKRIIGMFSYTDNDVVVHSDTSFMPRSRRAWASWNYHTSPKMQETISLTYHMNSLQHIPAAYPVFVTLNPRTEPKRESVHARFSYAHPVFNLAARTAQLEIPKLQDTRHTLFAGAYLGFGFHEDGARAAVEAVQKLGFPIRLVPDAS